MEQGQSRGRIGGLRTTISIINNQVIIVSNAQLPTVETKPDDRPSEWIVQETEAESGREMDYEGTHFLFEGDMAASPVPRARFMQVTQQDLCICAATR